MNYTHNKLCTQMNCVHKFVHKSQDNVANHASSHLSMAWTKLLNDVEGLAMKLAHRPTRDDLIRKGIIPSRSVAKVATLHDPEGALKARKKMIAQMRRDLAR